MIYMLYIYMCVCVSPPGQRVHPLSHFHQFSKQKQGGKASSDEPCPTKLSCWRGSEWRRPFVYLQLKSLLKLFHSRFVSWWFHDTSPKPTLPQQLRRRFVRCCREPADGTNHLFKHLQLIGLLTLPLCHSFPWGTELTEYNCQSVFRSAVPLGC